MPTGLQFGCHLPVYGHAILESRVRDLDDMTAIYEKFAKDVRPGV